MMQTYNDNCARGKRSSSVSKRRTMTRIHRFGLVGRNFRFVSAVSLPLVVVVVVAGVYKMVRAVWRAPPAARQAKLRLVLPKCIG